MTVLPALKQVIDQVETKVPEIMAADGVPGVSLAVIGEGSVVWARGFGVKAVGAEDPVTAETVFEAGSLGKPVFAYAVLQLCEKGRLDLDAPLSNYLSRPYVADPRLALVTARRVLSHTAGFPNWRPRAKALTFAFRPGERFGYSGEGYVYLQTVMEHALSRAFAPYMRSAILEPFGMKSSSFIWRDLYEGLAARGHDGEGTPTDKARPRHGNAAWSLHTTPLEFARFLTAILRPRREPCTSSTAGSARC